MSSIIKLYWNISDGTIADVGDIKPIADKVDETIDVVNPLDDEVKTARGSFTALNDRLNDDENKISDHETRLTSVENEIETARGGEPTLNDRINNAETSAWTAANDSYGWADTDEDVQFTDSKGRTNYSAYHWAKKAQEWATIIDGGSAYD